MRIDTSRIENYRNMTTEEKLAALEGYEYEVPTPDTGELQRLKDAVSRANSEAAEYKKQLKAKMSDDEAKAQQEAEEREAMVKELEGLRKEKAISGFQAKFLGLGYDADAAAKAAKALHAGDFDTVFATQEKFIEATKKSAVAESLKKQPSLSNGAPLSGSDVENAAVAAFRRSAGL